MLELMNCFLTRGLTLFLSGFVRGALLGKNLKKYIYLCHYFSFFSFVIYMHFGCNMSIYNWLYMNFCVILATSVTPPKHQLS